MAECSGLIETQLDASYNTTMSVQQLFWELSPHL